MEVKSIYKPCPKCKAGAKDIKLGYEAGAFYVYCAKCGTDTDKYTDLADAMDAWNKGQV